MPSSTMQYPMSSGRLKPVGESRCRSGEKTSSKLGFVSKQIFRLTNLSPHAVEDVS